MMGRVEALVSYFKNNKKSKKRRRVQRAMKMLKPSVGIKEVVDKNPRQSKPVNQQSKTLIPAHKLLKTWRK